MEANEAPEKIYFDGESKACKLPIFSSQNIEYIRKYAFIEKAAKWINEHTSLSEKLVIENFINYKEHGIFVFHIDVSCGRM